MLGLKNPFIFWQFWIQTNANIIISVTLNAASETKYLNASNREMCALTDAQLSSLPCEGTKSTHKLLEFKYQELKSATGNFRPDNILGGGADLVMCSRAG